MTVADAGSKLTINNDFVIGSSGKGTLRIEAGGQIDYFGTTYYSYLGRSPGSTGTATVTGAGSKWSISYVLTVGTSGSGILNIEDGGQVSSFGCTIGASTGSGIATVHGIGSKLTLSNGLVVGDEGTGKLRIEAGGEVISRFNYVGADSGSNGTATITGMGSKWISTSGGFVVGYLGSGMGTLNIGEINDCGGTLTANSLILGNVAGTVGTCNINNGGTLQAGVMRKGNGTANFNWNDGTIQNYNVNTNLAISNSNNLVLKLAATGTHAFNIDAGRTGTIDAVLSDATSGGTLAKQGQGLLTLTGVNTYSGQTTVEAGRFKVTGSILNTSGMDVSAGATLELAKTDGSATAGSLAISNAGTVLISAGSQTVGAISGSGIMQVNAGTLTATSIVQNSLSIGTTGASATGDTLNQVPEPGTMTLLLLGAIGTLFAWVWRR